MGYAFVNFISPQIVYNFYNKQNGVKWTHNNQEKVTHSISLLLDLSIAIRKTTRQKRFN
jgi:hypothetical protein